MKNCKKCKEPKYWFQLYKKVFIIPLTAHVFMKRVPLCKNCVWDITMKEIDKVLTN